MAIKTLDRYGIVQVMKLCCFDWGIDASNKLQP